MRGRKGVIMTLTEKASYLKGLADGFDFDKTTKTATAKMALFNALKAAVQ